MQRINVLISTPSESAIGPSFTKNIICTLVICLQAAAAAAVSSSLCYKCKSEAIKDKACDNQNGNPRSLKRETMEHETVHH
jgi:hypothetical protein